MDINVIVSLIGSLGFPIVMCGIMSWYINKSEERHKNEIDKLSNSIDNNTIAMNKLVEHIERGDK